MDWTGTLGQELFLLLGFLASSARLDVAASTESLRFRGATVKEIPFFKAFSVTESLHRSVQFSRLENEENIFDQKKSPQPVGSW